MVVYACNLSYVGGSRFKVSQDKKASPYVKKRKKEKKRITKLGVVLQSCNPSYLGGRARKIKV
jgi:hypothetical protein